jgi:hypothetical protein
LPVFSSYTTTWEGDRDWLREKRIKTNSQKQIKVSHLTDLFGPNGANRLVESGRPGERPSLSVRRDWFFVISSSIRRGTPFGPNMTREFFGLATLFSLLFFGDREAKRSIKEACNRDWETARLMLHVIWQKSRLEKIAQHCLSESRTCDSRWHSTERARLIVTSRVTYAMEVCDWTSLHWAQGQRLCAMAAGDGDDNRLHFPLRYHVNFSFD